MSICYAIVCPWQRLVIGALKMLGFFVFIYFYLFKQCLKRMTQLAINNYSTLWSSN